VNNNVLRF